MSLWDSRYDGPGNCPVGCAGFSLPGNSIQECPDDYLLLIGEIRILYLSGVQVNGTSGKMEAITKPSNWLSESGYGGLTALVGFGDKPKAEPEYIPLPGFTQRVIDRNHSLNFDVTDASQDNIDLLRQLQCGKSVAWWAITHDDQAIGGPDGVISEIDPGLVFARGKTPVTGNIVLQWSNKYDPQVGRLAEAAALKFGGGPAMQKARFAAPPPELGKLKSAADAANKSAKATAKA